MSIDIDKLQQELQEKVQALEVQRRREAEEFEQLRAQREKDLADEKAARLAKYKAQEEARLVQEAAAREAWAAKQKEERDAKVALEMEQEKAAAAAREYEDRLHRLEEEISKVEFAEEQRRKVLEQSLPNSAEQTEITDGVHGLEPPSPLMSEHLKRILRQSERHY